MSMSRKEIHDLNNLLNRITITCGGLKDTIETAPLEALPAEKLKELSAELTKAFSDMEQAAMDASNIVFKV